MFAALFRACGAALVLLALAPCAAATDAPPSERLRAREAFARDGFGIFVHWGIYAAWGKGEWHLNKSRMPLADYEARAAEFNPTNFDAYFAFMTNQLSELLTRYGPVRCIWFDGEWDHGRRSGFDWRLDRLYGLVHGLQPACLVGNNSHADLLDGEDFQIWEINYPGDHAGHMNDGQTVASGVPLECCWSTTDSAWGYNPDDPLSKMTATEIVRRLVRTRARGANLLLNVAPAPDGTIPETIRARLAEVGAWIRAHGHTVLGTEPAAYKVLSTVSTISPDGKKVWLHCISDANPKYGMWMQAHHRILAATNEITGEPVPFEQVERNGRSMLLMTLAIPEGVPDTIVRLDVEPFPEKP